MNVAALALVGMCLAAGHGIATGVKKLGHELKHEPPKVLHLLGIHRGHLKAEGRKI